MVSTSSTGSFANGSTPACARIRSSTRAIILSSSCTGVSRGPRQFRATYLSVGLGHEPEPVPVRLDRHGVIAHELQNLAGAQVALWGARRQLRHAPRVLERVAVCAQLLVDCRAVVENAQM